MLIEIDPKNAQPPYLQIVEQIKVAVASGRLRARESLPSIRQLAERLRVNRNTVDKAYRELDQQGVIETVRGKGAFIANSESPFGASFRRQRLHEAADALIVKAHDFKVTDAELFELLARRLEALAKKRRATPDKEVSNGAV